MAAFISVLWLARMIQGEGAGDLPDRQVAAQHLAAVALNRIGVWDWPDTLEGVITQPFQFNGAFRESVRDPAPWAIDAAERAIAAHEAGVVAGPWRFVLNRADLNRLAVPVARADFAIETEDGANGLYFFGLWPGG